MQKTPPADDRYATGLPLEIERLTHDRRAMWRGSLFALFGLLGFIVLFGYIIAPLAPDLSGDLLLVMGLLMSLLPATIWLVLFHEIDRQEPMPKQRLMRVWVLAALLTGAIAQPLLIRVFEVDSWLYDSWRTLLAGNILVVGMTYAAVLYLTIRFGIFYDPEFEGRVDGVIYGTVAGLGIATLLNVNYVFDLSGVDLRTGSLQMAINALIYGSLGGILGYFMGLVRFQKTPSYTLPSGLIIVSLIYSLYFFLPGRPGASQPPFPTVADLLLAVLFACSSLLILNLLVRRSNDQTRRRAQLWLEGQSLGSSHPGVQSAMVADNASDDTADKEQILTDMRLSWHALMESMQEDELSGDQADDDTSDNGEGTNR